MKLDSNDLTRRQNITVALLILISISGGYYLTQFIGMLGEYVALFGLVGSSIWIIYIRARNRKARLLREN